jgi:hypothetical protein
MNDRRWTGVIPEGTPIVQVIPFKRDAWNSEKGTKKNIIKNDQTLRKLKVLLYNSYKRQFWTRKEYK